jgi:prenyltransferase beta subunit
MGAQIKSAVHSAVFSISSLNHCSLDTCYSFWIGAALVILGQYDLVVFKHTRSFTMSCQKKIGGFGKHPDAFPDVLHSYFSLCGLSFAGEPGIQKVHPGLGFSVKAHDHLKTIHGTKFIPMSTLPKDKDYDYK